MDILVLGVLAVRRGPGSVARDLGGRKPKQILEILVAARGHPVSKDGLIDHLWGEHLPRHPVAALENHVWVLRRHLADGEPVARPSAVVSEFEAYRLATDRVTLDLDRFDALVAAADRRGLPSGRPYLEGALELVRGEVFEDEPYADWAAPLRETYRGHVHRVRLDAAEAALLEGDPRRAAEHAASALGSDPLSERTCRLLMAALAGQGERAQAVRVFDTFRSALEHELHLQPLPATVAVWQRVRDGVTVDPAQFGRPRVAATAAGIEATE